MDSADSVHMKTVLPVDTLLSRLERRVVCPVSRNSPYISGKCPLLQKRGSSSTTVHSLHLTVVSETTQRGGQRDPQPAHAAHTSPSLFIWVCARKSTAGCDLHPSPLRLATPVAASRASPADLFRRRLLPVVIVPRPDKQSFFFLRLQSCNWSRRYFCFFSDGTFVLPFVAVPELHNYFSDQTQMVTES